MYFRSSNDKGAKVVLLGEYNSGAEIDVASKYAQYTKLKPENFLIMPTKTTLAKGEFIKGNSSATNGWELGRFYGSGGQLFGQAKINSVNVGVVSYDNSTGKLKINATSIVDFYGSDFNYQNNPPITYRQSPTALTQAFKVKVYIVDGEIEDKTN